MVFRTNFAYQRYWEAIGMVQAMAAKWLDGACMGIVFDAGGNAESPLLDGMSEEHSKQPHPKTGSKGGPAHSEFAADLVHVCSLLHALALQHFRDDGDLGNITSVFATPLKGSLNVDNDDDDALQSQNSINLDQMKAKMGLGTFH